ncbi:MAG: hypothetical protein U1D00_19560 [Mycobacterium sp.]|nr:hypothetical protein [Mycobacterium sp.]
MPAAVRPYVTAGVALVGASVISVTPIQPVEPQARASYDAYSLTASAFGPLPGGAYDGSGDGVACSGYHTDQCDINAPQTYTPITVDTNDWAFRNVLPNLVNAFISVPRAYLDALNDVAYSMEITGSWWVYTPTNVLGYDPADPPKITSITNLLIPFQALSNPLGEHLSWWAKANLPMNAGCTGTAPPVCQDADAILARMFTAPIWDLIAGYTFPALNNPVSAEEGAAGEEIPGSEGTPVPWSGEYIQINPYDPVYNVINYLFRDPELNRPEPITFAEVAQTVGRLVKGLVQDFYPFVPGSFLWKGYPYTLVTPFIKPFVKILCPNCDPEHPEDPTPFDGELPPSSEDAEADTTVTSLLASAKVAPEATAEAVTEAEAATAETAPSETAPVEVTPVEEAPVEEKPDVVSTAVANLLKKFDKAPAEAPAEESPVTEVESDKPTGEDTEKGADEESGDSKDADTASETESDTEKKATVGGKDDDSESKKSESQDKSADSGSDGAKSSAGAGSGSSAGGADD